MPFDFQITPILTYIYKYLHAFLLTYILQHIYAATQIDNDHIHLQIIEKKYAPLNLLKYLIFATKPSMIMQKFRHNLDLLKLVVKNAN